MTPSNPTISRKGNGGSRYRIHSSHLHIRIGWRLPCIRYKKLVKLRLDKLQLDKALGYVARRYPLTATKPHARQLRFVLEDPLLRFWFRFVFPHKSAVQRLGPVRAFSELVKPQLDSYFGSCFERLCRESLSAQYARDGVAQYTVGEYWDADTQIDVVGLRGDRWIDLGECKWGPIGSTASVVSELRRKASAYPKAGGATIGHRVFAHHLPRDSVRARHSDIIWQSLADLYAEP